MVRLEAQAFDPEAELAAFRRNNPQAGAVASFLGCVRGGVDALVLEHHPSLTSQAIAACAQRAAQRFALEGVLVIHRHGRMAPGEPIVLVACASAHRRAAFEAASYLMDYLKTEAPFWKREERAGARRWIEPRPQDYAARDAWAASTQETSP